MIFFHHDNRRFDPGETITGNHYEIRREVLDVYQSDKLFPNMQDVLYMTDLPKESWDYDHVYVVMPNKVVVGHSIYSVVMCNQELLRCCKYFKCNREHHADYPDDEVRRMYIQLMYSSYLGDVSSMRTLALMFGYSSDGYEELEYITDEGVVLDSYFDYHDEYSKTVYHAMYSPILSRIKEQRLKNPYTRPETSIAYDRPLEQIMKDVCELMTIHHNTRKED